MMNTTMMVDDRGHVPIHRTEGQACVQACSLRMAHDTVASE
jgi:hypothetical protein